MLVLLAVRAVVLGAEEEDKCSKVADDDQAEEESVQDPEAAQDAEVEHEILAFLGELKGSLTSLREALEPVEEAMMYASTMDTPPRSCSSRGSRAPASDAGASSRSELMDLSDERQSLGSGEASGLGFSASETNRRAGLSSRS
eukprot:SRR837773.7817.p1 GENE.SRR837773.7817~~SRR837773.7817.p1  ORF type:complete len:143 (+),score=53.22 SRR837773.7817:89-517(+)